MGLPSFLTASASLPQALTSTAAASRSYAASPSAGRGLFPLEVALSVVTMVAKAVVAVARRRSWVIPPAPESS